MRLHFVLVVVLAAGCGGSSERDTSGAPVSSATALAETSPSGGAADRPDPVAAAVTYVASTDGLMAHSPIGRREILRKLATPEALAEQVAGIESAAAGLAEQLGVPVERLTWVEAPLTATPVRTDGRSATVDVWAVSVLGSPDGGPPQQAWRTVHVDLVLVDGEWLVSAADADAGPTPRSNDLALPASWDEFVEVAGWPAVAPGVGL